MTAPSTRPSTGLKKTTYLGQLAILSALILSVAGSCTVNTTNRALYLKQGTVSNNPTLSFTTSNGFYGEINVSCKKAGKATKCDSTKSFCMTYTCSTLEVKINSATYLGTSIGSWKTPNRSGMIGNLTYDDYYSCY
ncbi:hypothetical protein BGZ58_000155 [Dissophora ornata]|nr:hypothetical protein BGZ58_000155 [Dissophora ornata]